MILEMHTYMPLCDVRMELNVSMTVVTEPSLSGADTVMSGPLSGHGSPFGSIHVTSGILSLETLHVSVKSSPAVGVSTNAVILTAFSTSVYFKSVTERLI